MIGFPTIEQQIARMAVQWPALRVTQELGRRAVWLGRLQPLHQSYDIQISYEAPLVVERLDIMRQQPRVRVMSPRLKRRIRSAEGVLPHVYWDDEDYPSLCLFDPDTGEWDPSCFLADTTVPWSLDWLVCYEGWRATGEWTGGGRHAVQPEIGVPS